VKHAGVVFLGALLFAGCGSSTDEQASASCDLPYYGYFGDSDRSLTMLPGQPILIERAGAPTVSVSCLVKGERVQFFGANFSACSAVGEYELRPGLDCLSINVASESCAERRAALQGLWCAGHLPSDVSFHDEDTSLGELRGPISTQAGARSEAVTEYAAYFASGDPPVAGAELARGRTLEIVGSTGVTPTQLLIASFAGELQLYGYRPVPLVDEAGFAVLEDLARADSSDHPDAPAIATDGEQYLVVSRRSEASDPARNGIRATLVTDESAIGQEIVLGQSGPPACTSSVDAAFGGGVYLVVHFWPDCHSSPPSHAYVSRISRRGELLDVSGVQISQGADNARFPRVAFGRDNFLIVFTQGNNIVGTLFSPEGQIVGGGIISTSATTQYVADVAFDGTNYLVVWTREERGYEFTSIRGARVARNGTLLDPGGMELDPTDERANVSLSFGAGQYLLAWLDLFPSTGLIPRDAGVTAVRIALDGTLIDSTRLPINVSVVGKRDLYTAFDGANYLAVWSVVGFDGNAGLYAATVAPSGEIRTAAAAFGLPSIMPIANDALGNSLGSRIVNSPESSSGLSYPTLTSRGSNTLLIWNDNIWVSGQRKSVRALSLPQTMP
jgi:hypothetical protein